MNLNSHPIFAGHNLSLNSTERFLLTDNDGSRAVLIEDSRVRWCDTSDQKYSSMPLEPVFMDIKHATMSKNGEFVCVYNDFELRVIEIPWGYKDTSGMAKAFQKCIHKAGKDGATFKHILFHPLAWQQNSLVILKDNDSITIADWNDFAGLEQVVLNMSNGAYSLDSYVSDIESITFGMDGVTLYALSVSEGADIFAFYPCLPAVANIPKSCLNELMYKSFIQYEDLTTETQPEVKKNTIKQLQFVSKLQKSENRTRFEIHHDLRQVRAQGPFSMAPFPEQIYSCTGQIISTMPIDQSNRLILMALDDGTIAIFLQDLELTMNWAFAGYNFNNSLALVELVNTQGHIIKDIVVNNKLPGHFFARTKTGVLTVDTTGWSSVLAKCLDESDLRPLGTLEFKSKVKFTQHEEEPQSVTVWASNFKEHVVTMTATKITAIELPNTSMERKKSEQFSTGKTGREAYTAPYTQPIDEILQLSRRFQRELAKPPAKIIDPRDRQAPLKNDSNETQLDLLTEYSREIFQKIALGQSLGATLHNRLLEQQSDLAHQLKTSGELIQKRQEIQETLESQATRSDKLEVRCTELQTRFDKLKDSLNTIGESEKLKQVAISKKELDWFREIRNQVLMFNQNVRTQEKQQEQLAFLKRELARISTSGLDAEAKSREEWQELRRMLEEDTRILQKCSRELNIASRQVPANP